MRKKIALIGNMNNAHYTLMRYLSDNAFDCTLLLFNNEISHFNPDSDTYAHDRFDKMFRAALQQESSVISRQILR